MTSNMPPFLSFPAACQSSRKNFISNQHAAIRGGHDSDIHPGQSDLAPLPITLHPFYVLYPVCCFPSQLRQHIPARLGARVSLRPVRLLHHPHAAAAGWRRRGLLPHLHLEGREGGRGMEIGSRECVGRNNLSHKNCTDRNGPLFADGISGGGEK